MRRIALALTTVALLAGFAVACTPPAFDTAVVASNLDHPWDIGFLPNGTMVVTERDGRFSRIVGGQAQLIVAPADVRADVSAGDEGGMLGLAVDPQFASNGYVFVCMASTAGAVDDVRVVRFTLSQNGATVLARQDVFTGLPLTSGRHSGCRPRFGPDNVLWVGTGDSATGTVPQNPLSGGGKVLRLNRDGTSAAGNPFGLAWYTRGHRNLQGLAFRPSDGMPFSVEHGTFRDDEINVLVAGGNYGWDPVPGYNELRPMTDLTKFPDAAGRQVVLGRADDRTVGRDVHLGFEVGGVERRVGRRGAEGAAVARFLHRGIRRDRLVEHSAHRPRPTAIDRAGARRQPVHQHRQRWRQRRRAPAHPERRTRHPRDSTSTTRTKGRLRRGFGAQVLVLRVHRDELGDVPAPRHDVATACADIVEGTTYQGGAETLTATLPLDLGVRHQDSIVDDLEVGGPDHPVVHPELIA